MSRSPGPERSPRDGRDRRLLVLSHTGLMSGAETVLLRMMEAARDAGWHVHCLTPEGPFQRRVAEVGISTGSIPDLKLPDLPRAAAIAVAARRSIAAARVLRRASHDADVILLNGVLGLPALRLARVRRPSAWLVHDVVVRREGRFLLRTCGGAADLAVAVSDAVAGPLRAAGLDSVVLRNGTAWPVEPAVGGQHPPVVGITALLTPWKGHLVLLDAVARLADLGVVVELAGGVFPKDGPHAARLERRAEQPDLAGRVRFLGHLDDVTARTRGWSVAVVASVDPEAAPLALLEHMSVGLPVVATDHGGAPEVLGEAGLLVAPGDAAAMADAIRRLLGDADLHRRCAAAGPRNVAARLTLGHQRARFLDLIDDLAFGVIAGHPH